MRWRKVWVAAVESKAIAKVQRRKVSKNEERSQQQWNQQKRKEMITSITNMCHLTTSTCCHWGIRLSASALSPHIPIGKAKMEFSQLERSTSVGRFRRRYTSTVVASGKVLQWSAAALFPVALGEVIARNTGDVHRIWLTRSHGTIGRSFSSGSVRSGHPFPRYHKDVKHTTQLKGPDYNATRTNLTEKQVYKVLQKSGFH